MLTLKQLNYALAVQKTKHFKHAAQACSVSQSALSTAILELEKFLGVSVFERNNQQVLVTPIGEKILKQAREIMVNTRSLIEIAHEEQKVLSLPLRIGVIPTIGPYLLPQVLPEVRRNYDYLNVYLEEIKSETIVEKVREGELDLGIIAMPFPVSGLHVFEFWEEDFHVLMPCTHPLAKRKEIFAEDLVDEKMLLLKEGHCLKDHVLSVCKMSDYSTDNTVNLESTSLYTIAQMVSGRAGLTFIPDMAKKMIIQNSKEIVAKPFSEKGPHRRIAFVTRLNYACMKDVDVLIHLFKQELSRSQSQDN
jgi:LysR family transcriptional regulator, hydrogen peroxide-inducible genes activator